MSHVHSRAFAFCLMLATGASCSGNASIEAWLVPPTALTDQVEVTELDGPGAFELVSADAVDNLWRCVAALEIPDLGEELGVELEFIAEGPFHAALMAADGRQIRATGGRFNAPSNVRYLSATGEEAPTRLLLYRAATEPGSTRFTFRTARRAANVLAPEARRAQLAEALIERASQKHVHASLLDQFGEALRTLVREDAPLDSTSIAAVLEDWYGRWLKTTHRQNTRAERIHFANAGAMFAAPSRRKNAATAIAVLRAGGGYCLEQARVAQWLLGHLLHSERTELLWSDSSTNGHVVCALHDAILDVTAGVVIWVRPKTWNTLSDIERVAYVHDKAWAGPSFILHDVKRGYQVDGWETATAKEIAMHLYSAVPLLSFDPATIGF